MRVIQLQFYPSINSLLPKAIGSNFTGNISHCIHDTEISERIGEDQGAIDNNFQPIQRWDVNDIGY
jgi:hypothetical protein